MESPADIFDRFLETLGGKHTRFLECITDDMVFDSPITGRAVGRTLVESAVARLAEWFQTYQASLEYVCLLASKNNPVVAAEARAVLQVDSRAVALPLAAAMEFEPNLRALRLYHTLWPLSQAHSVRPALFNAHDLARTAKDVSAYHRALETGDAEKAAKLFEANGTVREPSGGVTGGREAPLSAFFKWAFQNGGVSLRYHRFVDTGARCAAEYTCYRWGNREIAPQAGIEVWDRSESGRFQAVRIYDDVEQPS